MRETQAEKEALFWRGYKAVKAKDGKSADSSSAECKCVSFESAGESPAHPATQFVPYRSYQSFVELWV